MGDVFSDQRAAQEERRSISLASCMTSVMSVKRFSVLDFNALSMFVFVFPTFNEPFGTLILCVDLKLCLTCAKFWHK